MKHPKVSTDDTKKVTIAPESTAVSLKEIQDAIFIAESYHYHGNDVVDEIIDKAHRTLLKYAKMMWNKS